MGKKNFWRSLGDMLDFAGGVAREFAEDVAAEVKEAWQDASQVLAEIKYEFDEQHRGEEPASPEEFNFGADFSSDYDSEPEEPKTTLEPDAEHEELGYEERPGAEREDLGCEKHESEDSEIFLESDLESEVDADVTIDVSVIPEKVATDANLDSDMDEVQPERSALKRYRATPYHIMRDGSSNGTPMEIYAYSIQTRVSSTIPRRVVDDAVGEVLLETLDDVPSDGVPLDYLSGRYWHLRRCCDRMGIGYNRDLLPETAADYRTAIKCLGKLIHRGYEKRQQEGLQVDVSVKLRVPE